MSVTDIQYAHLSNDLFWTAYHHDGDHFEKMSWTGYNDAYWWHNVAPTEQFLIKACKCGKKFKLNIDEQIVTEVLPL